MDEYTDDEDFNELVNIVVHPRAQRTFRTRVDSFELWNEKDFLQRFRLSKNSVRVLIDELGPQLRSSTNRNHALSPEHKVLATLRFLATGSFLQVIGDLGGFDKSTACRAIHHCLEEIAHLRPNFVRMPRNAEEIEDVRQGFFNISRFPRCIGALDCTHIKIQSPGGQNAEIYRNRKGYFSFNVQALCDSTLLIKDIVCRWPGSSADATIFNNSRLRRDMELRIYGEDAVLLGDAGYPVRNYLFTPLQNPTTPSQALYNESHIRTRNPIERCFGVFKRRFPILAIGIRSNIEKVEEIVVAAAVLHNLAINMKDAIPNVNDEIEAAIELGNIEANNVHPRLRDNEIGRYAIINQYFQALL